MKSTLAVTSIGHMGTTDKKIRYAYSRTTEVKQNGKERNDAALFNLIVLNI